MVIGMIALPSDASLSRLVAAAIGAGLAIGLTGWFGWRSEFRSDRMRLVGVALGGIFSSIILLMIAGGHPQASTLLSWFSGSTAGIEVDRLKLGGAVRQRVDPTPYYPAAPVYK